MYNRVKFELSVGGLASCPLRQFPTGQHNPFKTTLISASCTFNLKWIGLGTLLCSRRLGQWLTVRGQGHIRLRLDKDL